VFLAASSVLECLRRDASLLTYDAWEFFSNHTYGLGLCSELDFLQLP